MFAGLRSRWTTWRVCANSIARHTSANARSKRCSVKSSSARRSRSESFGRTSASVESALDASLAEEACEDLRRRILDPQSLDRDRAADLLVACGQHLAHAALAE